MNNTDRFTLMHSASSIPLICSSSTPLAVPAGHRIISCAVLPACVKISISDRDSYNLPERVLAWRISSLENEVSEVYTEVEFLDGLRAPDSEGISVATFKPLCNYARDVLGRIAPQVERAVMDSYKSAKSLQNQSRLF